MQADAARAKEKKAKKASDNKKNVPFSFEFSDIRFPSQPADAFRTKADSTSESVTLWVESRKTKQQWQATFTEIGECGPAGIPERAILAFLQKAFELTRESKLGENDPMVDLIHSDGEMVLTLTLSMGGIWRPEYVFMLLPVGLEKVDMLEAKMRDAQEEIESLRTQLALKTAPPAFLSLSSTAICANGSIVVWNANAPQQIECANLRLSPDRTQLTVLQEGVYQVYVRLAGTNSGNTQSLGLQLNGQEIAQCTQSDANGHQNTPQLLEIMRLKANDVLQVRCGANSNSLAVANGNRFTILYLGA